MKQILRSGDATETCSLENIVGQNRDARQQDDAPDTGYADPALVKKAYSLLDEKISHYVTEKFGDISLLERNLTKEEKIELAKAYRSWIEILLKDNEFMTVSHKGKRVERTLKREVVLEVLVSIGNSEAPHALKKIQDDLEQVQIPGYEIAGLTIPFKLKTNYISGDTILFLEWYVRGNKSYLIGNADVSGKAKAKEALDFKAYVYILSKRYRDLSQLYQAINNRLVRRFKADDRMITASSILLPEQHESGEGAKTTAVYIDAGHVPLLLYKAQKQRFKQVKNKNVVLGLDKLDYTQQEIDLIPGDILILCSDGYLETVGAGKGKDGKVYHQLDRGLNKVRSIVRKNSHRTAKEVVYCLEQAFIKTANGSRVDDATLILIKYTGA